MPKFSYRDYFPRPDDWTGAAMPDPAAIRTTYTLPPGATYADGTPVGAGTRTVPPRPDFTPTGVPAWDAIKAIHPDRQFSATELQDRAYIMANPTANSRLYKQYRAEDAAAQARRDAQTAAETGHQRAIELAYVSKVQPAAVKADTATEIQNSKNATTLQVQQMRGETATQVASMQGEIRKYVADANVAGDLSAIAQKAASDIDLATKKGEVIGSAEYGKRMLAEAQKKATELAAAGDQARATATVQGAWRAVTGQLAANNELTPDNVTALVTAAQTIQGQAAQPAAGGTTGAPVQAGDLNGDGTIDQMEADYRTLSDELARVQETNPLRAKVIKSAMTAIEAKRIPKGGKANG